MCVGCSRHVLLMRVSTVYIKRRRHTQPSNQHNPWEKCLYTQPTSSLVSVHIYLFPSHYISAYRLCLWADFPVISSDLQASERKKLKFINALWLFFPFYPPFLLHLSQVLNLSIRSVPFFHSFSSSPIPVCFHCPPTLRSISSYQSNQTLMFCLAALCLQLQHKTLYRLF